MTRTRIILLLLIAALAGGGWYFLGGKGADKGKNAPPATNVVTATAEKKDLPLVIRVTGNVVAGQSVAVKSRIDSQIMEVRFKDGDDVKKGDVLFVLDPRTLEAQLQQLQSNLARDRALYEDARLKYQRARDLKAKGYETTANLDTAKANFTAAEANLAVDSAAIESAKVQLGYTTITAPIDGRAGTINLTVGNNVKANDAQALVVINEIRPIRAQLAVPQNVLPALRKAMEGAGDAASAAASAPDVLAMSDNGQPPVAGKLTYIDNQIDAASGTFVARATFANEELRLWPGMFVNLAVKLGTEKDVLLVPETAVQHGQSGDYLFAVAGGKAAKQAVMVTRVEDGMAVITGNVKAGDAVVVDGALGLKDGDAVSVRTPEGEKPSEQKSGGKKAAEQHPAP